MIKYTPSNQLALAGFSYPFDQELSPENRWVKLAQVAMLKNFYSYKTKITSFSLL